MNSKLPGRTVIAATVAALMGLSYAAGAAAPPNTDAITRLEMSVPFLTKAEAFVNAAPTNCQGYPHVAKAKAHIADAIKEIDKAVNADGG